MLDHCRRRWANINSTLGEYPVFVDVTDAQYKTHLTNTTRRTDACLMLGLRRGR